MKFKYSIGQNIKDKKRNLVILEKEIRQKKYKNGRVVNEKWYKCLCKKCGWGQCWIEENHLKDKGCACCSNKICIRGINDIATIRPDLLPYFTNIEEAYNHTTGSGEKTLFKCPNCGLEKELSFNYLCKYGFSCNNCLQVISYPNKFMREFCRQLLQEKQIKNYECEKRIKNKVYDIIITMLNDETLIIENHGEQHGKWCKKGELILIKNGNSFYKTLKSKDYDIKNDIYKCRMAYEEGIDNYIQLNCSRSELLFMKKSILSSQLNYIFDLTKIDWLKCEEYCNGNITKEICDLYNKLKSELNREISPNELIKEYGLFYKTTFVYNTLIRGNLLGWCKYTGSCQRVGNIVSVEFETGKIKEWGSSISDIARSFGLNGDSHISSCCKHKRKYTLNNFWYYIDEWDAFTKEDKEVIINKAKNIKRRN